MDKSNPVNTLFLDIGGVMLTNGWGHESRILAAVCQMIKHSI